MATKTQFLPYAHRYQDATTGLREALSGIQAGIAQRGELRVKEADQKIRQDEADRLTAQRSFLANYQPTLSEDHLTNEGLERYNSLIEHNKDRLSAMDDNERETVRQKLLRETADANRVARTVREDMMGSGFFNPVDVDVLATSYGSGYTDYATAAKTAYDTEVASATGRTEMFKNAAIGLGKVFGGGPTGTNGASAAGTADLETQAMVAAGLPDPKTGKRLGFPQKHNDHNDPLLERYNKLFQDDPKKDHHINLLENRGLVTYQKNALSQEIIEDFVKVATADKSLGMFSNSNIAENVEAGLKAYYHWLDQTGAGDGGRVAAPPPEVLRRVLFDGIKKGGLLTNDTNINANGVFTSDAAGKLGELFQKAHEEYLDGREKELESLLKYMADNNFDFYGTKFPELNQKFYGEKPSLSMQDYRTLVGRTETGGTYAAPTQAAPTQTAQQPPAAVQGFNAQTQPTVPAQSITPAQQLEQLKQIIKLPPDVKEGHFGGLEAFPSPESFTAVMLPMAEGAAARIGVSPQHILVQAIQETGWGKEPIVSVDGKPTYNLFGIKAYGNWNGPSALVNTTEVENGKRVPKQEPFRVYNSFAESFEDYVNFLQQNPRYRKALEAGAAGDGPAFLNAVADAGYATDNKYKKSLQDVLRSVERRIPEGYTPGNFVASPTAQQYTNTQVAGTQQTGVWQQQGHPATEHLRALLNTYPQPYTEKSFTYDKIDAAFRRLGLTVPATEKVQANLTPVAAGVGSFPSVQAATPTAPATQPAQAPAAPAVTRAELEAGDARRDVPIAPIDWEGRDDWKGSDVARVERWLAGDMPANKTPEEQKLLQEFIKTGLATGNREAEMLIDRQLVVDSNMDPDGGGMFLGRPMNPALQTLPSLWDLDSSYLSERIALMNKEPLRDGRVAAKKAAEQMKYDGDFEDILWRGGPGEVPINFGPFTKMRHLPDYSRKASNPVVQKATPGKWQETMGNLFPSTSKAIGVSGGMGLTYDPMRIPYAATEQAERTARGDMLLRGPGYGVQSDRGAGQVPQAPTQAPVNRSAPPLRPPMPQEEAKSLPVQREENSNNFLSFRQDRQQELRDLIESRTNQGIGSKQQPEQEVASETAGASERYEMLADIIRELQQSISGNRRMTLGNIA